jgi:hypothetical protein
MFPEFCYVPAIEVRVHIILFNLLNNIYAAGLLKQKKKLGITDVKQLAQKHTATKRHK